MHASTVLILIPFIVALIASVSKTTKEGKQFPYNLTLVGWILIALAGTSATLNYLSGREKAKASAIREFHALRQLETAVYSLMSPVVIGSDSVELKDRFQVTRGYGETVGFEALCNVDISKTVGSRYDEPEFANFTWAAFITQRIRDGVSQLSGAQAAYGELFSDEMNSLIGQVASHPWNEFLTASSGRLQRIRQTKSNVEKLLLCSERPKMRQGYRNLSDSYWKLLGNLESRIGQRHCHLRRELNMADAPPLFVRFVSGAIYIPDPAVTEPVMKEVCERLAKPAG